MNTPGKKGKKSIIKGVCAQSLSCVRLFATPWTIALQSPLSMEFPRQEYWSRLPFPSPRDGPKSKTEPRLLIGRWILYH